MRFADRLSVLHLALVMGVALGVAPSTALGQSLWSIAGTFNGWATDDPEWVLAPVDPEDPEGLLQIDRFFDTGLHSFKFVRDGSWDTGHFGAGDRPGALTEPGDNIRLRIEAPAVYSILLSPLQQRWVLRVKQTDEPTLIVRVRGVPQALNYVTLDYSRSVVTGGLENADVNIATGNAPIRTAQVQHGSHEFQLRAEKPGTWPVTIGLRSQDTLVEERFEFTYLPKMNVRWVEKDAQAMPESAMLEPQNQSSFRALVDIFEPMQLNAIRVEIGTSIPASHNDHFIDAGIYMVEVVDGEVTRHANPEFPDFLHPGNWKRFVYVPSEPADRVFLIGDFNNWAGPDQPGAIELFAQWDGSYSTIIELPEGEHRYQFLIDGVYKEHDRENDTTVQGEDGELLSVTVIGKGPDQFAPAAPNEINLDAVRHDPSMQAYLAPISEELGLVDFRVRTLPGDVEAASLLIGGASPREIAMHPSRDALGFDRWSARVSGLDAQQTYRIRLREGEVEEVLGPFQANVEPGFDTPDWAKGIVWYQIFAERFRNGNPANDPTGDGVYAMPWQANWYEISPEEEAAWRARFDVPASAPFPPRKGGPLYHVVWDRRYGGDLQGVLEKLDHLVELGVGAIYFNPVFEAESMHKYDATAFHHIDDNFANVSTAPAPAGAWIAPEGETADPSTWTWTEADRFFIDEFLPACRARGIRVVIDGVFNHTGTPFFAFQDLATNGADSAYRDWFMAQFDASGQLEDYVSWDGGGALPKFNQEADRNLVDPVREHIFAITRRWMDPNGDGDPSDGVDGWRLDVPLDVGLPFWAQWRALVKDVNPEAIIIAEIWNEADPYTRDNYFDTNMHYPFAKAVVDWLGVRPGMTSTELRQRLEGAFDDAPQTLLIHQNLYGSHDTDRFVSMLQNPNRNYDEGNRPQDHDYPYDDSPPSERTYALSLLGVAIQATYIGAPMVYYGDELGMWGADDPTDRKPVPWPDLGSMDNPAENARLDILEDYQRWFMLRQDETIGPILRYGSVQHLDAGDENVFAYVRALNGSRVLVVVNRQDQAFDASGLLGQGGDATVPPLRALFWLLDGAE